MELQPQPVNTPDPNQAILMQNKFILTSRARSGTDWFFWIAGLSIINSVISLMGGSLSFVSGLGITQLIDGIAGAITKDMSGNSVIIISIIAFLIDMGLAGLFVVAGWLGRKRYHWVVIAGMLLYGLDALVFILLQSWLGLLFHGWALFGLWGGLQAIYKLNALEKNLSF